ncbi:methyl-accepting chemotaxis protein [Agaribacter flavus]|uniref:Methyl-accepting chemotaxis protein n=1 Tax=Agaribacter flavus TaxID=1902781 RepID=A0ABV7FW27_9ALTE
MMSDADRKIVYMNDSVYKLLKKAESSIRKDLPQFNVESLIGTRIDSFHHNPTHQHAVLDALTGVHEARLNLGGYSFRLMINPIRDENGNDLGNSVEWHDMTEIYKEERRVTRILEALDCTSTNVMLADADRNIIYMNRAVKTLMKQAESDLKKVLPHFDADNLIGVNMDTFHKDPSHQKGLLDRLKEAYTSQIKVGPRHFRLIANPIFNSSGERIGSVVEWLERTKEVNAEQEIAEIVQASLEGNFEKRVDESDKEGFMLTMAQGLNQLMKTTETGLNEVSNVLLAISEGDLTKRVDTEFQGTFNDLKNYCNTTNENLVSVISKIREASDTINNASSEIAQGNADLSARTEQQASSLEETASSMEELTSTVRLNAENANQANGLASQAAEVAGNGGDLIKQVVTTMASINESAQKISDIIGVIDGIAFQTNILALNAAVEAARAGEQGRGFAVVASEVRTLAQRSANAAKDIKDLISDSVAKVESGNELVNQSGDTMQEIVVAIQRVNDIMSEIAAASAEQASGIDEVSKAVSQMDEMTQQNAALVEEAAAAAESMRGQAGELNNRVGAFKLSSSDVTTTLSQSAPDLLTQQFDELPSVGHAKTSPKAVPAVSQEDEWESF